MNMNWCLCVIIDDEFSWQPHTTKLGKAVQRSIPVTSRPVGQLKYLVDPSKRKPLFFFLLLLFDNAHVPPDLPCVSIAWDGSGDRQPVQGGKKRLLNCRYRRGVKPVCNQIYITTTAELQRIDLLPVTENVYSIKLEGHFEVYVSLAPQYLTALFYSVQILPPHLKPLLFPDLEQTFRDYIFFCSSVSIWNSNLNKIIHITQKI